MTLHSNILYLFFDLLITVTTAISVFTVGGKVNAKL